MQGDDDGTTPNPTPAPSSSTTVPTTRTTADGRLIVEAGELGWVEVPPQDVTLSETGCGAIGCVEENTRVSRGGGMKRGVVVWARVCVGVMLHRQAHDDGTPKVTVYITPIVVTRHRP